MSTIRVFKFRFGGLQSSSPLPSRSPLRKAN